MIVARLLGGLGNQMFQYALGRQIAVRHRTRLLLDTSWFERERSPADTPRQFSLDRLRIKAAVMPPGLGGSPQGVSFGETFAFRLKRREWPFVYIPGRSNSFEPDILAAPRANLYLNGFWQSALYFDTIASDLRTDFSLAEPLEQSRHDVRNQIRAGRSVSVHVRRGDYVTNAAAAAYHGTCSSEWYTAAFDLILDREPMTRFFVFSDDTPWCRANLPVPPGTFFVDQQPDGRDAEDMHLMSICQHHIIANSSFSWWGAWLNPRSDKIVIAPRRWSMSRKESGSFLPAGWITI